MPTTADLQQIKLDAMLSILAQVETPAEKQHAQGLVNLLLAKESIPGLRPLRQRREGTLLRYLRAGISQEILDFSSDITDAISGGAGEALARFYAGLFNDLSLAGSPPSDATVETASEELDPLGWTIDRDESGVWFAAPVEVIEARKGPLRQSRCGHPWQYAAERAPKGGISIAGTFYPGGRFIPGKAMEQASPEDRKALSEARTRADLEKASQSSAPKKQKAKATAQVAAQAPVAQEVAASPEIAKSAERSLKAIRRIHGEKSLERIGVLTEEVQRALGKAKPEKKAALQKRLAELAYMAKVVAPGVEKATGGVQISPDEAKKIEEARAKNPTRLVLFRRPNQQSYIVHPEDERTLRALGIDYGDQGFPAAKLEATLRKLLRAGMMLAVDDLPEQGDVAGPVGEPNRSQPKTKPERLPQLSLADAVARKLAAGETLSSTDLRTMAGGSYGGTMAEGKYDYSAATDAMEAGFNRSMVGQSDPRADLASAQKQAQAIAERVNRLPTQTNRSGEKDTHQQFSTPPHYAFAAVWAANIQEGESVLEPSAGTGCLAVQAANAGGVVYANELSKRRAEFLRDLLGSDKVSNENAEQISAILKGKIPAPSVVVMNPPFSQTAGRMGNKKELLTGARHIDEALELLAPGGRLVAIVGRGMTPDSPTFRDWFAATKGKYNLRANIGVPGDEYKKYGTHFDTRVLVIDKTPPQNAAEIYDNAGDIPQLMSLLEGIRNDRNFANQPPPGQSASDRSTQPTRGGVGPTNAAPAGVAPGVVAKPAHGGGKGIAGAGKATPGKVPGMGNVATGGQLPGVGAGSNTGSAGEGVAGTLRTPGSTRPSTPGGSRRRGGQDTGGKLAEQPADSGPRLRPAQKVAIQGISPDELKKQERIPKPPEPLFTGIDALGREWINGKLKPKEENAASLFEGYRPQLLQVPGAKKHATPLVESAAMASVLPPMPVYQPTLSPDVIDKGILSDAQLESLVYAGQAHEQFLPAGEGEQPARRGYFIGDGTGVGKGRQIAGVIADNYNQGRTKHVWISQKQNLLEDAHRDWSALGMDPAALHHFDKIRNSATPPSEGVSFITYDTLKGRPKDPAKPSNLEELVNWLGKDFDGVIAFDEAHGMANAITTQGARGEQNASQKALAGIKLQQMLPNARVLYVSATGATEVSNLAYAERLGLWGRGTAFAEKSQFIDQMNKGGVAAMEAVAQSMKAMGAYNARSLSFDDGTPTGKVTYDRVTHKLSPEQKFQYDTAAKAWQEVLKNIDKALELTGASESRNAKSAAVSQFWGAQQRFFNQVMTSMQTPSVILSMEKDLAEGRSPVIQLVNTMEAATKRAKERMGEGDDFEDMDVSPKEVLMQYLEKSFPVHRYEEYYDEQSKSTLTRPVKDSNGQPVVDPRAAEIRDNLLDMLGSLRIPESPLDMIINHFGHENVAEATGRTQRIISQEQEDGSRKKVLERRNTTSANAADTSAFQSGKKKILVFSDAGGTGRSYHADRSAENQKQRVHYMLQPGWRADNAVQGLGRTHRTNQAVAPTYRLVEIEDLKAQKRFISTIARRLDQLGALTRGQRQAGSGGLFDAADNLESYEASEALAGLFRDLQHGEIEGLDYEEVMSQLGYKTEEDDGRGRGRRGKPKQIDVPPMSQFLNRLLSLEVDQQGKVFDAFDSRLKQAVEVAVKNGTLDRGVENFHAESISKESDKVVYKDQSSGAEVRHLVTKVKQKANKTSWDQTTRGELPLGYVTNKQSGRIYAYYKAHDATDARTGSVEPQYKLVGPTSDQFRKAWEVTGYSWGGGGFEKITPDQARQQWDREFAEAPDFVEREEHFLAGALLPVWDRIPGEKPKIFRVKTADGQSTVARHIPRKTVEQMLKNMGIQREGSSAKSTGEIHSQISTGKATAKLSNGWKLKPVRVQGERRIELIGPDAYHISQLTSDGVMRERINYDTRFFIPTGADGVKVLERIIAGRPITDVEESEQHSRRSLCRRYANLSRQALRDGDRHSARIYARQAQQALRYAWENRGQVDTNASGEAVYNWVDPSTGESRRQHIEPGSSGRGSGSPATAPAQPAKQPTKQPNAPGKPATATPQEPKPYGPSRAKVKVSAAQKQQVASLVKDLFGDKLPTPEHVASVVGAPDDSRVTLIPSRDGKFLFAHIDHPSFQRTCERYIGKDANGRTFMHNEIIDIKGDRFRASVGSRSIDGTPDRVAEYIAREEGIEWTDALKQLNDIVKSGKPGQVGSVKIKQIQKSLQGNGLGGQIFGRQVEQAKAAGVSYIECHAARKSATGHDYFNGYITWPKLGYNQSIEDIEKTDKEVADKIRERFPDAKDILDVVNAEGGEKWWQEHGVDLHNARFDLSDGSKSMQRLENYRRKKAAQPPRDKAKPQKRGGLWGWLSQLWGG